MRLGPRRPRAEGSVVGSWRFSCRQNRCSGPSLYEHGCYTDRAEHRRSSHICCSLGGGRLLRAEAVTAHERINQLPVVIAFFNEFRSEKFVDRERYLWANLPGQHDPNQGFTDMPEPLRTYMFDIGIYYQTIAYLVAFKVFDRRLAYLALHHRLVRTWRVIAPFVRGERRLRGAEATFLNALEEFVEFVRGEDDRAFGSTALQYPVPVDNSISSTADPAQ